jgi:hypothetical protein
LAYIAYALAWIAVAIGVSVGIYFTKSAWCLWAFIFPLFISITHNDKKSSYRINSSENGI